MKKISAALLSALLLLSFTVSALASDSAQTDIIKYLMRTVSASSEQQLIDGFLTENAGNGAQSIAYALCRTGSYSFSKYSAALEDYNASGAHMSVSTKEKHALLLMAMGKGTAYAAEILDSSAFALGVMSRVFALHIVNNGFSTAEVTSDTVISSLLSMKKIDGGWAVTGDVSDIDCTAMVIQSLAPYYGKKTEVTTAINAALSLLSSRQQSNGGFVSYGKENSESTAQVIIALASLGINPDSDSRFVKNNNKLSAVLSAYQLSDGSFAHTPGDSGNMTATAQALEAFTALKLLKSSQSYYVFSSAQPAQEHTTARRTSSNSYWVYSTQPTTAKAVATSNITVPDTTTVPHSSALSTAVTAEPSISQTELTESTISAIINTGTASEETEESVLVEEAAPVELTTTAEPTAEVASPSAQTDENTDEAPLSEQEKSGGGTKIVILSVVIGITVITAVAVLIKFKSKKIPE